VVSAQVCCKPYHVRARDIVGSDHQIGLEQRKLIRPPQSLAAVRVEADCAQAKTAVHRLDEPHRVFVVRILNEEATRVRPVGTRGWHSD
jgi:hypothetical protein